MDFITSSTPILYIWYCINHDHDFIVVSAERVVSNLSEYGNTSAASIPLALDGAVRNGSIKKGDVVSFF